MLLPDSLYRAHSPNEESYSSKDRRQRDQDQFCDPRVVLAVVCAVVEIVNKEFPDRVEDDRWHVGDEVRLLADKIMTSCTRGIRLYMNVDETEARRPEDTRQI